MDIHNEEAEEEKDEEDDKGSKKSELTNESDDFTSSVSENRWFSDTNWANIRDIHHPYLPTFPKRLKKDDKLNIESPYPLYSSNLDLNIDDLWKPFNPKPDKTDNRLDYCRKLYTNSKNKLLMKDLDKTVVSVPKYLVEIAIDSFGQTFDEVWYYTGGLLDCLDTDKPYVLYVNSPDTINCVDVNSQNLVSTIRLNNSLPIYNIKCSVSRNTPTLGVRQQSKIFLFQSFIENSVTKPFWSKTNKQSFIDMAFYQCCNENFCTLDSEHNLTVEDVVNNLTVLEYSFNMDDSKLLDYLGNILLLDENSLAFMNRCCVYLLDLRSKSVKKKCLKDNLACDELCTLSKKKSNTLYISSKHSILEFDVKVFGCSNKVMHTMSTPPFVSSLQEVNGETYLSLMGQNDRVLMRTSDKLLSLPQYVPKITDTLRVMCSTVKLDSLNIMDERLTFPNVGMKMHIDPVTDDFRILTSNTAGDVFQQRILNDDSTFIDPISVLANWTWKLSAKPKVLEVTGVCNLNIAFHSVVSKVPHEKYVEQLIKDGTGDNFVKKNVHSIEKDIKSKVGEVMDALWEDDDVTEAQETTVSSQSKVIEWLTHNTL